MCHIHHYQQSTTTGCLLPPKRHLSRWRTYGSTAYLLAVPGLSTPTCCEPERAPRLGSFGEDETLAYWLFWVALASCESCFLI